MLTMRSEFLGNASEFRDLPEAINDGLFLLPRLTRDQLAQAITGPIAVASGRIAPSLVQRLLNDVGDDQDQLPVLQHALLRTWEEGHKGGTGQPILKIEHYEAVKGLAGALSEHADEAFLELDERQKIVAATIFKALTERGPDSREVRRPMSVGELAEVAGVRVEEVVAVIDHFRREGRSFLLSSDKRPLAAEAVLDISHESLMRKWKRLADWMVQEAEDRRIFLRLSDSAALYAGGEEPFLRDPRLTFLSQWRTRFAPVEGWARRYAPNFKQSITYLEMSLASRRRRVLRQRLSWGGSIAAGVLLVVGGWTWYHKMRDDVERQELHRQSEKAEQEAKHQLEGEYRGALERAVDAKTVELTMATNNQLREEKLRREEASKQVAQLTEAQRETQRLAIGAASETARIEPASVERAALVAMRTLSEAERANDSVGVKTAMTALADHIRLLPRVLRLPNARGSPLSTLTSSDGILSALSLRNRQLRIWRVENQGVSPLAPPATINGPVISWDSTGRRTAWVSGRTLHVWDAEVGEQPGIDLSEGFSPVRLVLSPNGEYAVLASRDRAERWSLTARTSVRLVSDQVTHMVFAANSQRFVTATRNTIRLWNAESGTEIATHISPSDGSLNEGGGIQRIALSASGSWLAWAVLGRIEGRHFKVGEAGGETVASVTAKDAYSATVLDLTFSPNEELLASAGDEGAAAVFALPPNPSGPSVLGPPLRIEHGRGNVVRIAFSTDSSHLATGGSDGVARVWRTDGTQRSFRLPQTLTEVYRVPHTGSVNSIAFVSGNLLATADQEGLVRVSALPSDSRLPTTARELMDEGCERVSRTLTAAEWLSFFRLHEYHALCKFPLDPRQVLEIEIVHARSGNSAQALQAARQFAAIKDVGQLDPARVIVAAVAQSKIQNGEVARDRIRLAVHLTRKIEGRPERARASSSLCWQAAMNDLASEVVKTCDEAVDLSPTNTATEFLTEAAIAYARMGDRKAARARFERAVELASASDVFDRARNNNNVCWRGAIYDFAQEVLPACDAAVKLEKNAATRIGYLDSQAIAYALIGTPELLKTAKENFETYVKSAVRRSQAAKDKRQSWILELEKGRNPFARDKQAVLKGLAKDLEQEPRLTVITSGSSGG